VAHPLPAAGIAATRSRTSSTKANDIPSTLSRHRDGQCAAPCRFRSKFLVSLFHVLRDSRGRRAGVAGAVDDDARGIVVGLAVAKDMGRLAPWRRRFDQKSKSRHHVVLERERPEP
jgi:hypothetical protein